MDIQEQVEQILREREQNESKENEVPHMIEGMLFVELATRYNQYLKENNLPRATECLQDIARLIIALDVK